MIKKVIFASFTIILSMIILVSACKPSGTLNFAQLTSQPAKYNGKQVTVEGFYFAGFEIVSLSSELVPSTFHTGNFSPKQPLIWITGNLGDSIYNRLYLQSITPSGYPERFGKVKVTGKFEYGGGYGHLNAYKYQLTVTNAEWLEWTPTTQ